MRADSWPLCSRLPPARILRRRSVTSATVRPLCWVTTTRLASLRASLQRGDQLLLCQIGPLFVSDVLAATNRSSRTGCAWTVRRSPRIGAKSGRSGLPVPEVQAALARNPDARGHRPNEIRFTSRLCRRIAALPSAPERSDWRPAVSDRVDGDSASRSRRPLAPYPKRRRKLSNHVRSAQPTRVRNIQLHARAHGRADATPS